MAAGQKETKHCLPGLHSLSLDFTLHILLVFLVTLLYFYCIGTPRYYFPAFGIPGSIVDNMSQPTRLRSGSLSDIDHRCKNTSCNGPLGENQIFMCIICGDRLHWTQKCTGFETSFLDYLSRVRNNFLLTCKTCSENGRRDILINDIFENRQANQVNEIFHKLQQKIENQTNALEMKMDKMEQKQDIGNNSAAIINKVKEVHSTTINEVRNIQSTAPTPLQREANPNSLRIRGIPEPSGTEQDKNQKDRNEIEAVFNSSILPTKFRTCVA